MSRQDLSLCVKNNNVSFSWHVSERMRQRRINKIDIVNCLKYGLLKQDADGKTVVTFQRIECAIAKNSIGITVCSAWQR